MDAKDLLGDHDIDDARWLCSLTDAELDLLIGLKNMVKMRAEMIEHESLADKFDLRMLRTFGFIFMEHLKEQLKDVPGTSDFDCNMLKQNLSGSFAEMTIEDLHPYLCDYRVNIAGLFSEGIPPDPYKKLKETAKATHASKRPRA